MQTKIISILEHGHQDHYEYYLRYFSYLPFTNHLSLTMRRLLKENKVAIYPDYTVFWKICQESFRHESIHK